MLDWIKSNNALATALITSFVALFTSVTSLYISYHFNVQSQDRQMKLEQVGKFDSSTAELIAAAGGFVSAINDNKNINEARLQLSNVIATQIHQAESIGRFHDREIRNLVVEYQDVSNELNQVAQKTSKVTDMRPWTETFGRMLDVKAKLAAEVHTSLGTQSQHSP